MRRVYIVRHGNTFEPGEAPRRVGGRTDLPLVAGGRAQAVALGRHFRAAGLVFDRCLTGPLIRTRDTATLLLEAMHSPCPVEVAEWLREIDHGPDEDRPEEEVAARIGPDALAGWDTAAHVPPGWIVDADARRRDWQRLFEEQARLPPGTTLIVTSNGAARFALADPPGKLRTGAWGVITVVGGALRVTEWDMRPA